MRRPPGWIFRRLADITLGAYWGAGIGLLIAAGTALRSGHHGGSPRYTNYGAPWKVAVTVFAAAVVGGALAGSFLSLRKQLWGAIVLASLAAAPIVGALNYLRGVVVYPSPPVNWVASLASALIVGAAFGTIYWLALGRNDDGAT